MGSSPLRSFDEGLRSGLGLSRLVGVDEAGRGPLAGPVVAAAVMLPSGVEGLDEVRDSKTLSPRRRERLFLAIRARAQGIGVGWALASEIDGINILQATFLAMRRALDRLAYAQRPRGFSPDCVLVDGNRALPGFPFPQRCLVRGDGRSLCVAAASVVAKVVRDRWMSVLDRRYPGYGLSGHKGYGTRRHLESLRSMGPCLEHRRSFAPVAEVLSRAGFRKEAPSER
ncbi:MAG: ribonuclease HII [Elusimicrobiota bacterium]